MIVVVLFTLLLLAGILAATLQLSLGSRQNTADQAATLQAQYAAESNLALMQSQIRDIQRLLSTNSIAVPSGTTPAMVASWGLKFCGDGASWSPTNEFMRPRNKVDNTLYPEAKQCTYSKSLATDQFNILGNVVPYNAFSDMPERPSGSSVAYRNAWWKSHLGTPLKLGDGQYVISPVRAVVLDKNTYRFYLKISSLAAVSKSSGTRIIKGKSTEKGLWWFQVELPNLLKNVLMTNHHRSDNGTYYPTTGPDTYFANMQDFDGDVFTNEKFLFSITSQANFLGNFSSAGCTDLPRVGIPNNSNGDCSHQAGVYVGGTSTSHRTLSGDSWNKDFPLSEDEFEEVNSDLEDVVIKNTKNVKFNGIPNSPNFAAQYKALPTNFSDQKTLANNGGLVIPNGDTQLYLFAGDSMGNPYDGKYYKYEPGLRKWSEPSPSYQYVYMYDSNDNLDYNNLYRIDEFNNIYKYDAYNKKWPTKVHKNNFNGLIYSEAATKINIYGPSRLDASSSDLSSVRPALASFSNISITSVNGMDIMRDLAMSGTPCANSDVANKTCTNESVKNTLGLFSPSGDISIDVNAPKNINIHAALMASSGEVKVENYDNGVEKGVATIIGSVIENFYGPFGKFSGSTATSGYQRKFLWDPRFNEGITPRGFPVSPTWNSNDGKSSELKLTDIIWNQGKN